MPEYDETFKTPDEIAWEFYRDGERSSQWALRQVVIAAIERDREQIRAYIKHHEHPDDWGVPCVYTSRLRAYLGMEPT